MSAFVKRLPFAKYQQLPGVHVTALKAMSRSPLHYQHRLSNPPASTAMTIGRTAHTAILEPDRFLIEYAVWDARTDTGRVRPRIGKDWDAFVAANATRTIILAEEYALALAMRDAVRSNATAMRYLSKGDPELTMQWRDEETDAECVGRLDWLAPNDVIVGVKSSRNACMGAFGTQAARLGYADQWAYYADGYRTITGREPSLVEIVVENEPPHDVAVFTIPLEIVDLGRDSYRRNLVKLLWCLEHKQWPGAHAEEIELTFPNWAYPHDDDIAELGLED